MMNKKK